MGAFCKHLKIPDFLWIRLNDMQRKPCLAENGRTVFWVIDVDVQVYISYAAVFYRDASMSRRLTPKALDD